MRNHIELEFSLTPVNFSPPIIILGMHRSGTSCLTGCLEEAGLYLGDVNTKAGFNAKGNRENEAIMKHHEAILNRVGASWDNPPQAPVEWTEDEVNHLVGLLSSFKDMKIWGVKDPRSLFLLGGWMSVTTPKFVGTFRHPQETAASLVHRAKIWEQSMDMDTAFDLWAAYNEKLLSVHKKDAFDIIRYDIPPEIYHYKLIRAALRLGLSPRASMSFREDGLHNQQATDLTMPHRLKPIWEELNDLAI